MTTNRTLSWEFDAAPEQVLARCADPQVALARAQADPNLAAQVTELTTDADDGALLVVTMVGQIPAGWLPSKVASRMGDSGGSGPSITRREAWYGDDDEAYASVDFSFSGVPATTMKGAARLTPIGSGRSELTYQLQLDVAIPIFGAMVENAVLSQVVGAFDKEAHAIAAHL